MELRILYQIAEPVWRAGNNWVCSFCCLYRLELLCPCRPFCNLRLEMLEHGHIHQP
jgi:hypothetical protein